MAGKGRRDRTESMNGGKLISLCQDNIGGVWLGICIDIEYLLSSSNIQ
jgi:hypothetical protein